MSKRDDFINSIAPYAQDVQRKYGVPASIVIAQAALETGWGDKILGNNLFGIKAGSSWNGATIDMRTHEFINGKNTSVVDRFRAFDSISDSFEQYGKFLASKVRYSKVVNAKNASEAADELQKAKYATDPNYAEKLKSIINVNNLTRFDDAQYQGYVVGESFENTRRKLQDQRTKNPDVWKNFIENFLTLIKDIFSSIAEVMGIKEGPVNPPPPTPTGSAIAGIGTPSASRG